MVQARILFAMEKKNRCWACWLLLAAACAPAEEVVDAPPPTRVYDIEQILQTRASLGDPSPLSFTKIESEADLAAAGDAVEIRYEHLAAPWMDARRKSGSIRHLKLVRDSVDEPLAAVAELVELETLYVLGHLASREALAALHEMKKVDHLVLYPSGDRLDASKAAGLAGVPGLRSLSSYGAFLDRDAFEAFADAPALEQLMVFVLGSDKGSNEALDGLAKLSRLRSLDVLRTSGEPVTASFLQGMHNLHALQMIGRWTNDSLQFLPRGLRHLSFAQLHTKDGGDFDASALDRLTELKTLIPNFPTPSADLARAIQRSGVATATLGGAVLTQEFVDALGSAGSLRRLTLRCSVEQLQGVIVRAASIASLEHLHLIADELANKDSAQALARHTNLKGLALELPDDAVGYRQRMKELRAELPNVEITLE